MTARSQARDRYYLDKVRRGLIVPPTREEIHPEESETKRLNSITLFATACEMIGPQRGWFRAPNMDWKGLADSTVRKYLDLLEGAGFCSRRVRGRNVETRLNKLPEHLEEWKLALNPQAIKEFLP